ncbi:MAG: LacI family transcriptional regulator [Lachnospiraceae bacterium]|nr:LacI family transcriptional regulator [Lachnospiraceae bacterium]
MKIKMVDIARHLGISKATVSLAMNNKPGVNEDTKKKVLECYERLSRGLDPDTPDESVQPGSSEGKFSAGSSGQQPPEAAGHIKLLNLNYDKNFLQNPEMELHTGVFQTLDSECRKRGLTYSISYLEENSPHLEEIVQECNMAYVKGIIVFGVTMREKDLDILRSIDKPIVINDFQPKDGRYSSAVIDNRRAVEMAMAWLKKRGSKKIYLVSSDFEIYNFAARREAFLNVVATDPWFSPDSRIISLSGNASASRVSMLEWLENEELPEAFLFENYVVAIGAVFALREKGIISTHDLELIGLDEVPEYLLPGNKMAYVKMPHSSRMSMCFGILDEMGKYPGMRVSTLMLPELIDSGQG